MPSISSTFESQEPHLSELLTDIKVGKINSVYRWRRIYTEQGDKTKVAEQQDALRKLQLENAELKMEIEMLKKAAAYFAKHLK